jgi:hypothetical protein
MFPSCHVSCKGHRISKLCCTAQLKRLAGQCELMTSSSTRPRCMSSIISHTTPHKATHRDLKLMRGVCNFSIFLKLFIPLDQIQATPSSFLVELGQVKGDPPRLITHPSKHSSDAASCMLPTKRVLQSGTLPDAVVVHQDNMQVSARSTLAQQCSNAIHHPCS